MVRKVIRTGSPTEVRRLPVGTGWIVDLPESDVVDEAGELLPGWADWSPEAVAEPSQPEPAEGAEVPQGEPEDLSTLTAAQLREHLADLGIEVPSSARTKAALLALFPGG